MHKIFLTRPGLFAISAATVSAMAVLNAIPAQASTFKATIYQPSFEFLEDFQIEYTLADGILEAVLSSPPNTFFTDGYQNFGPDPVLPKTLVPEVVTEFKWSMGGTLQPFEVERSIFGITGDGLYLQILDPNEPPIYKNIFESLIQAPDGLPISACKTQACEGSANFFGKGGYYGSRLIQTPVTETESVPEPSVAVALGFIGAWLVKRHHKAEKVEPVPIKD